MNWDSMPELSKLSLVVPTYTRQEAVKKLMHFWSGSPVNIYVLDGSAKGIGEQFFDEIETNIKYFHMPVSIQERMKKSIDLVHTKYVDTLCDDEFYIPSAVENCMKFLDDHTEYVACTGICLGFNSTTKGIRAKRLHPVLNGGYGCEENTAKERMINHMAHYVGSTIYAIQTAAAWKNSMGILSSKTFSTPYVHEYELELTTCYQGKSRVLNEVMWLRNTANPPVNIKEHNRWLQYNIWFTDPRYKAEVYSFYQLLSSKLSKIDGTPPDKIYNYLRGAMRAQLEHYNTVDRLHLAAEIQYHKILNCLGVTESQKKWIRAVRLSYEWKPIMMVASRMLNEGVAVDLEQLEEIVKVM